MRFYNIALGLIVGVVIAIIILYAKAEYHAVKKYYPLLTWVEYLMLNDKLRITPNG